VTFLSFLEKGFDLWLDLGLVRGLEIISVVVGNRATSRGGKSNQKNSFKRGQSG